MSSFQNTNVNENLVAGSAVVTSGSELMRLALFRW